MVDIIIPAYNAHNTIKRTLASIAMQENYKEIRVTIVDDCSAKSYDEIAKYFSNLLDIQIIKMEKNGGPGVARQVGFDHTSGEYVMWMDADDTLYGANSVMALKMCMIEKDQDCVYGQFLEESENGQLIVHEKHMVWMFGKMYRRAFLNQFSIRFNTTRANEDTGFNCVVKGCTTRVWYVPIPVYIWHFKANSITRINDGMYGFDSGYKGYIDNMIWQLTELEKRFVNKNYVLHEVVAILSNLYFFHEENRNKYPMNIDVSMEWIRGYYQLVYKDREQYVTPELLHQTFIQVQADQDIARRIIPSMTLDNFMEEIKKPCNHELKYESGGATPVAYKPVVTPEDWPITTYQYPLVDVFENVDSNTNIPLHEGMDKIIASEKKHLTTGTIAISNADNNKAGVFKNAFLKNKSEVERVSTSKPVFTISAPGDFTKYTISAGDTLDKHGSPEGYGGDSLHGCYIDGQFVDPNSGLTTVNEDIVKETPFNTPYTPDN